MYHSRITHDGMNPVPPAHWPAPDVTDDATQRKRRMHAAGVGFAALVVALPALVALVYFARQPVAPDALADGAAFASNTGRAFVLTTWSLLSMLGALAAGAVLAGAVRCRPRTGAVRMLLALLPAALFGAATAAVVSAFGVDGDARLRMAGMALLVSWCTLALGAMLRATRGYGRRHTRSLMVTALPLLLLSVPLAHVLPLLPTLALAFAAWTLLAASAVWHPRERATPPFSDQYARDQLARRPPAEAEHLRFPLHQRR